MNGISIAGQEIKTSILKDSIDEPISRKTLYADERVSQFTDSIIKKARLQNGNIQSQCLCLQNMYDPNTETGKNWQSDLLEDVTHECSKYGRIIHANVPGNKMVLKWLILG